MDVEFVREAVDGADLVALRTALIQATGDEVIRELPLTHYSRNGMSGVEIAEEHQAVLKERAVRFLIEELAGFEAAEPSDAELRFLLESTLGRPLSDEEFDLHRVSPGFDEFPRAARWRSERPALPAGFRVAIVGAGLSGVAMGVQLGRLGIPYEIYERRSELGGTWSINTYPDARVDTPSATYEYRFVKHHEWSEYFARQAEVRAYAEKVARDYGVIENVRFEHDVTLGEYDEETARWRLTIERRDGSVTRTSANILVTASGLFAMPKPFDVEGAEQFEGEILHTTEWTAEHSAAGKSVAVIGNGSTGVQLLGRIAEEAAGVHVFQRTPQWISPRPRYGRPIEEKTRWLLRTMPYYWNWTRFTPLIPMFETHALLVPDPEWQRRGGYFNEPNDALRAGLTEYIKTQTGNDPGLVDRLVPDYPPIARRLIVDNGWYRTLTRDHVELVTEPIDRIERDGIVTMDGEHRPVDMILAAVGFSVTKYLWPTLYRGRGGQPLEDRWRMDLGGPRAYAGVTVPGFPNMFILYGPNAQPTSGGLAQVAWMEIWASYAARSIVLMLENGHRSMEVTEAAYDDYNTKMDERAAAMIWSDPGSVKQNYYVNETGRLQVGNPWQGVEFFSYLKAPRPGDYHFG